MAAALTLNGASAEQQAFELSTKFAAAVAADKVANPTADLKGLRVTRNIDVNAGRVTISIVLPLVETASADGGVEFDADVVLA